MKPNIKSKFSTMKAILSFLVILMTYTTYAQIGINTDNSDPDPSAMLDVKSTDKGLLVPRMDSADRSAIPNPATGLMVFDNSNNFFYYYNGSQWVSMASFTAQNGIPVSDACVNENEQLTASFTTSGLDYPNNAASAWQSFTTTNEGYLSQVDIRLGSFSLIEGGNIKIYSGEGTGGSLLYQAPLTITSFDWTTIVIPGGSVFLNTSTKYTIYLEDTIDNFIWVDYDGTPGYGGGRSNYASDLDHHFRAYVADCVTPFVISPTSNGTTVNIAGVDTLFFSDNTYQISASLDDQNLELNGDTLSISNGNSVVLPKDSLSNITDADNDTKIQVEETANDDKIRFDVAGSEVIRFQKNTSGQVMIEIPGNPTNTFLGTNSGLNTLSSTNANTFLGISTGFNNETGIRNTSVGASAGSANVSGSNNTYLGSSCGSQNAGENNVMVGENTGAFNYTGSQNTFVGRNAGRVSFSGSGNIYLGYEAGKNEDGNNKLYIENSDADSANALIYGEFDNDLLAINGSLRVNDGTQANGHVLTSDVDGNASWQQPQISITDTLSIITNTDNDTKIQVEESADEDIMRFDIAGTEALVLRKNSAGGLMIENVSNAAGGNTLLGTLAGDGLTSTALYNVFMGQEAGRDVTTGDKNTFIGRNSGTLHVDGTNNTFVGFFSGRNNTNGVENTMVGSEAGLYSSGSGNVFIGRRAGQSEAGSHKLYIENSSNTTPLIYGEFDNNLVRINGDLEVTGQYPGKSFLEDNDGDTKIQVEESPDEDIIRFDLAGNEKVLIDEDELVLKNGSQLLSLRTNPAGNTVQLDVGGTGHASDKIVIGDAATSANQVVINGQADVGSLKVGATGSNISQIIKVTINEDLGTFTSDDNRYVTWTVNGAQPGATVTISPSQRLSEGIGIMWARVTAANTVEVKFRNACSNACQIDPPAMDFYVLVIN